MAHNPHRGEVPVTIAGEQYTLRYTFGTLARLDQALGVSFMKLLAEGNLGHNVVLNALWFGLKEKMMFKNITKLADALENSEFVGYVEAIMEALRAAGLLGGEETEEAGKAEVKDDQGEVEE